MRNEGIRVKTQHSGRWHQALPQAGSFIRETGCHGGSAHRAHRQLQLESQTERRKRKESV